MIKKILYHFFYLFEEFVCLFFFIYKNREVIVIRTDAIGDYILFRNFLKPLYEKYGKLTLVGNIAYQDFALELDGEYIQEFIPIDRRKFTRNILYRLRLIKKLRSFSYNTLINPIYSRDRVSEDIVKIINAKEKIASIGDYSNLSQKLKNKYNKNYTTLLPAKNEVMFEFYRNFEFFRNLISQDLQVNYLIELENPNRVLQDFNLTTPYTILFIGASAQYRKWSDNNFIEIGRFLYTQYGLHIVICGGKEDFENGEYIKKRLEGSSIKSTNLCGKTSLLDLARIIYNCNLLISNETSAVHLAIAIQHNRVIIISNGNHFQRFTPYPIELTNGYFPIYHKKLHSTNHIGQISYLDINDISTTDVIKLLREILKQL